MDAAELKATIARLDAMDDRVRKVIAKHKHLEPDRIPQRRPVRLARPPAVGYRADPSGPQVAPHPPIASGQLAGNEMRARPGYRPQKPTFVDVGDGSLESIFADFEAQFDEMAQAHRA